MAVCEICGNDYERSFTVTLHDGSRHTFDSFECAIHGVAPRCHRCGCPIIGHGREVDAIFYCCDHCIREHGDGGRHDSAVVRPGDAQAG